MKQGILAPAGMAAAALLMTCAAQAGDIRFLSNPTMKPIMDEIGGRFEQRTGNRIVPIYELFYQSKDRIEGDGFDVIVFTEPGGTEKLTAAAKIDPATVRKISQTGIGVAIRTGAPKPDIGTAEGFKRALLQARAISYTKDSTAGTYIVGMIDKLGLAEELKPKTKLMSGGGQNPRAVAAGDVDLGISMISDIIGIPGAELLGPLPPELQNYLVETAAVGTKASDPAAARALIEYLGGPEAAAALKAKGMDTP